MCNFNTIKFIGDENEYLIKGFVNMGNVVQIYTYKSSNIIPKTNGFIITDLDGKQSDFSSFTTRYDIFSQFNGFAFSNNGRTETKETPLIPKMSQAAKLNILTDKKINKIEQTKTELADFLATNPIKSMVHGNKEANYSVTQEKQILMMNRYLIYQSEKTTNPDAILTWNESGHSDEIWTEEDFLQLMAEIKDYVYPLVLYQQQIEEKICACTTLEELDEIEINYTTAC